MYLVLDRNISFQQPVPQVGRKRHLILLTQQQEWRSDLLEKVSPEVNDLPVHFSNACILAAMWIYQEAFTPATFWRAIKDQ